MTMDITKDEVEYLSSALETHVVTYHSAARELNIHVSRSKEMLFAYYKANKGKLTASFIATGTRGSSTVVKLAKTEADLAELSASLDKINTVHVYGVSLAENSFSPAEIALEELQHPTDHAKIDSYHELGLTKGPALVVCGKRTVTVPVPKAEPKKVDKEPVKYQLRKEATKPSMISNYVSRKGEKSIPAKREAEKPAYQYKSRKIEKAQPKERVVISSMEEEPEATVESASKATGDVKNLFLDDLSDFSDDNAPEVDEPIAVEESTEPVELKTTAPLVPEDSILRSLTSASATSLAHATPAPEEKPETTIDEDGYITSYRKEAIKEPKKDTRKAAADVAPKAAKSKKPDGQKKQASLMSFFGKR